MTVGVLRIQLFLPENQSLKGKRHVVRSIIERIRAKFEVAVAEVEDQDRWQSAVIGVACISNEARHVNEVLSHVVDFVERFEGEAQMMDYQMELVHPF